MRLILKYSDYMYIILLKKYSDYDMYIILYEV